ncbi:MAG: hypothetical protein GX776_06025 [Oxalobacter sp.]|nr:hypothetical protein [Oxalobacter sp.]
MRTSETITKIAPALLAAQKQITFAAKDAKNPHFKNTYASLPSVIDAIKGALNENGIVFIQTASPSEKGCLALSTRLLHESGEWIEDTATVPLPKSDPQGYGSAATYARRYCLAAVMGLYQDDDDGNAGSGVSSKAADFRDDLADTYTALREADTAEDLQRIFADAWKTPQITKTQQQELKKVYEQHKKRFTA